MASAGCNRGFNHCLLDHQIRYGSCMGLVEYHAHTVKKF